MSLTKPTPLANSKSIPLKPIAAVVVAIVIALGFAMTVNQLNTRSGEASTTPIRLGHQEFLELNTTAMPTSVLGAASIPDAVSDRFVEINTTALPATTSVVDPEVTDEFLYWNVDAFASISSTDGGAQVPPIQPAGPR